MNNADRFGRTGAVVNPRDPPPHNGSRKRQRTNGRHGIVGGDGMDIQPGDPSFMSFSTFRFNEESQFSDAGAIVNDATTSFQLPSSDPDQVLMQMIRRSRDPAGGSGPLSHQQVVEFCRSSGIPLSRMLRLDLLGLCCAPGETEAQPQRQLPSEPSLSESANFSPWNSRP